MDLENWLKLFWESCWTWPLARSLQPAYVECEAKQKPRTERNILPQNISKVPWGLKIQENKLPNRLQMNRLWTSWDPKWKELSHLVGKLVAGPCWHGETLALGHTQCGRASGTSRWVPQATPKDFLSADAKWQVLLFDYILNHFNVSSAGSMEISQVHSSLLHIY